MPDRISPSPAPDAITLADIRAAAVRIAPFVHRTPVLTCATLDALTGAKLFFKFENFQKTGAFKARGATNAVLLLDAAAASRGVITHSSGNHGAALALAARRRGIAATVVVPHETAAVKKAAMRGYGATLIECPRADRDAVCAAEIARSGAHMVHPFDDDRVIAGQGTAAVELLADLPDLAAITCPVGGGGLFAGSAVAAHALNPAIRMIAAEPAAADDAARGFASGVRQPAISPARSIADGLLGHTSDRTFALLRAHAETVVTVSEAAIIHAMRLVYQHMKIVIEPSCAVPLAALIEGGWDARGGRVGVILTGGNVDLAALPFAAAAA
jgi:threonine dehydratase